MPDYVPKEMARTDPRMGVSYLKEQFPETKTLEDLPFLQRTMGRIMEWAQPRKALKERAEYYGEKLADPVEAAITFGPMPLISKAEFMAGVRGTAAKKISPQPGAIPLARRLTKEAPQSLFDYIDKLTRYRGRTTRWGGAADWNPAAREMGFASFPRETTPVHEVGHALGDLLLSRSVGRGKPITRFLRRMRATSGTALDRVDRVKRSIREAGVFLDKEETKALTDLMERGYYTAIPTEAFAEAFAASFASGRPFRRAVKDGIMQLRKNILSPATERSLTKMEQIPGRLEKLGEQREALRDVTQKADVESMGFAHFLSRHGIYPGRPTALQQLSVSGGAKVDFPNMSHLERFHKLRDLSDKSLEAMWKKHVKGRVR